jgi:hypothetical protein
MFEGNGVTHPAFVRALPTLAKSTAVKRLQDELVARGFGPDGSASVARVVTDPSEARRLLQAPSRQRIADGTLLGIITTVWVPGVAPLVTNFRMAEDATFPIAGGNARAPLPKPTAAPDGRPERSITVGDSDSLIRALDFEIAELLERNRLVESIAAEGVRENLLLSVLSIEHANGAAPVAIPVSDDGSSRLSSCYEILGLRPEEVIYTLRKDERAYRSRIGAILDLANKSASEATEEDYAKLAALVAPAFIVVGFESDDPKSAMDIAMALEYRVGNLHVDPPKEWSVGSKYDSQLSAALDECVRKGKLSKKERLYFEGMLSPDDAGDAGFSPDLDRRGASIQRFFVERKNVIPINAGVRGLLAANSMRFGPGDRMALAVEAAIRPFRANTSRTLVKSSRQLLQQVYEMSELASGWTLRPKIELTALRDEALKELETLGKPGPACRELLCLAGYHLAENRVIRPTSGGQHQDKRATSTLLRALLDDAHGIRFLHQAIVDGRAGSAPRAVNEDGSLVVNVRGEYVVADDAWVRRSWPAPKPAGSSTSTPVGGGSVTGLGNPIQELHQRKESFRTAVRSARDRLAELGKVLDPDTGQPLVSVLGLSPEFVSKVNADFTGMMIELLRYQAAHENRTDVVDEDDVVGAEDDLSQYADTDDDPANDGSDDAEADDADDVTEDA